MAKMPEEGRFEYGKMDKQTGAQWVHVTPEMARAHPQGKLNLPLWLITGVFAAFGLLQLVDFVQFGDWLALFKATLFTDFCFGNYARSSCCKASMLSAEDRYPTDVGCEVLRI